MSDLLKSLRPKERRGSKPRCHLLTHGSPDVVSARLTSATKYMEVKVKWLEITLR